jgi:putative ABC transport system permease protein
MRRPNRVAALLALCLAIATTAAAQQDQTPTILISRQLATAAGLGVNDIIVLSSDPNGEGGRRFRVAGTYEPTPDPMRLGALRLEARLHLPDLISLTASDSSHGPPKAGHYARSPEGSEESVTAINIALRRPADIDAFVRDVKATVPIPELVVRTARGDRTTGAVFVVLDRFHLAIALVTLVASTTFLLALMVMLVEERRQAVGVLRLIGLRKRRLLLQVVLEGLVVALVGVVFGILLAAGLQRVVNAFFQWRYDTALIFVRITPRIALQCSLLAVPLGVFASLISSWTLLRSEVLDLVQGGGGAR